MFKARKTPIGVSIFVVGLLCVYGIGSLCFSHPSTAAGSTTGSGTSVYSLGYSQISTGASSAESSYYSIEDVLTAGGAEPTTQQSDSYSIINPIAPDITINSGLATRCDTSINLTWTETEKPTGATGYDVYRSSSGQDDSYEKINSAVITATSYEDTEAGEGAYYYIVFLIDSQDRPQQWTAPFYVGAASSSGGNSACTRWMLYE